MSTAVTQRPQALDDRKRLSRLHGDHAILEARVKGLRLRAYGDWADLDEVWLEFTRDLEAHMAFEEDELFAWFLRENPDQQDYIDALLADHETIRNATERLGTDIQLHYVRVETVDGLLDALKQHAASEQQVFYPWLEEKLK